MKLLRYGEAGHEKPACMDFQGKIRDLSNYISDLTGEAITPNGLNLLNHIDIQTLPIVEGNPRIGSCIHGSGKFLCIGLNYKDHAAEAGLAVLSEPVLFSKVTSAISGPYDDLIIPKNSTHTDWEVELGVIIGQKAKRVSEQDALDFIAGYCVINDVSERHYQLKGTGQWIKGKSCDTFGPIGPWLVTKDEIKDPHALSIWLEVDGHRYQDSNTSNMVFKVPFLVSYLSQFFTLYPGDIISTGTPAGVGLGQKPNPIYLKPGQVIRLGITGLGEQRQTTVAES